MKDLGGLFLCGEGCMDDLYHLQNLMLMDLERTGCRCGKVDVYWQITLQMPLDLFLLQAAAEKPTVSSLSNSIIPSDK